MCSSMRWNSATSGSMASIRQAIGRPGYHPSPMLKLYIYGYLNRVQSSRRLEREAGRNLEVMWLTGRLVPDQQNHRRFSAKTTAPPSRRFVRIRRLVPQDGATGESERRDRRQQVQGGELARQQLHERKMERRLAQIEESVARYLSQLDTPIVRQLPVRCRRRSLRPGPRGSRKSSASSKKR